MILRFPWRAAGLSSLTILVFLPKVEMSFFMILRMVTCRGEQWSRRVIVRR